MTDDNENLSPLTMEHVHYILRESQFRMHNIETLLINLLEVFLQKDTDEARENIGKQLKEMLEEFKAARESMPSYQALQEHLNDLVKLGEKLRAKSH